MEKYIIILAAVASYLIGSVNFSILISKAISGKDIRKSGSGNAGATNMLRTHGKKMAILTLALDVFKGVGTVLVASYIAKNTNAVGSYAYVFPYIAAVCVILGHNFPIYFGFKGGKGVATSIGSVFVLDWKMGIIIAVLGISIMAITRYVSLGSIIGGAAYIVLEIIKSALTGDISVLKVICVVFIGGLLIVRHRANIKRLINGSESKLGAGKEKKI